MLELRQLGVETEFDKRVVSEIPTPNGVAPLTRRGSSTGVRLNGFFVFTFDRTPHESKHFSRGGAEGKRTRYDLGLGGSSRTIRATGRIIKSGVLRKQT